ncbi:ATP-binding protein [Chloroflexia bacterium SDU3-3]|nr:ATP-binding protein [Chloroflexia bacterium SDU3-3]
MQPLTVAGNLDSLSAIAAYVQEAARVAMLDAKTSYRLRLAVDEIATNIITHGYGEHQIDGSITVSASLNGGSLTIVLDDTGVPFDPLAQPPPTSLAQALHTRTPGGLGIYLARHAIDTFAYRRAGSHNYNSFTVSAPVAT